MLRSIVALSLLALASLSSAAPQSSEPSGSLDDWRIDVGVRGPVTLGVAFGPDTEEAREIERVLRADLEFASVLRLVDPSRNPPPARDGRLDYYAWEAAKAELLVTGVVSQPKGELQCRLLVHEPATRRELFGTDYRVLEGDARRLAHRIADDLLEKLGVEGVAETHVAFVRQNTDGQRVLVVMDYDGARQREVTSEAFLMLSPRWQPDGAGVSVVSFPARGKPPELALVPNGGKRRTLFASEKGMVFSSAWSPDGERLAFASSHEGNAEIYVMRGDGTGLHRLTDHPGIDVSPTWSPTGREIAFTSNRSGSPQIYIMDEEGLNLRRVSYEGSYNAEPAWSPSRERSEIAYATRTSSRSFDIAVLDLLTRRVTRLTRDGSINDSPSWSPNGEHLVFSSTRTGSPQIFVVHRDGTGLRQLTDEGENRTPSWGPK